MNRSVFWLLWCFACAGTSPQKNLESDSAAGLIATEDSGVSVESTDPPDDVPDEPDPCDGVDSAEDSFEPPADCPDGRCEVPTGPFTMGSFEGYRDECPARTVTLDAFGIDQTEVTWSRYEACVAAGTCEAPPEHCRDWVQTLGAVDNRPVTCVTWDRADAFCRYEGGRLPTEAEWEKAARGTTGSKWPWGSFPPNCEITNYRFVAWYCEPGVVSVGQYLNESIYGAQDMAGNAWEWVADHYDAEWYRQGEDENPLGPTEECRPSESAPAEPCIDRGLRGGAYNSTASNIRGAARSFARPGRVDKNIGFRCAYSP